MLPKLKPLVEIFTGEKVSHGLEESAGGKKALWLETVVQRADVRNRNGRVYPRPVLEREIQRFQSHIDAGTSYGEADHPEAGRSPSLPRQAVLWRKVWMESDGAVKARGIVLETAVGRDVAAILEAGGAIGSSSRGRGTVSLKSTGGDGTQNEVVNDDYRMRTFDLVIDQSVEDAQTRGAKYEQALIEQELSEEATMELTLEELKTKHPKVYESLLAEAKKKCAAEPDDETVEALFKARGAKLREAIIAELEEKGDFMPPAKKKKAMACEAFAELAIEGLREAGLLESITDDAEVAAKLEAAKLENADLQKKIAVLEAANTELAERLSKIEVKESIATFAKDHVLAEDMKAELTESCKSVDDFNAKKEAVKARYDKLATRITAEPQRAGRGNLDESEAAKKAAEESAKAKKPELTETQKRLAANSRLNG